MTSLLPSPGIWILQSLQVCGIPVQVAGMRAKFSMSVMRYWMPNFIPVPVCPSTRNNSIHHPVMSALKICLIQPPLMTLVFWGVIYWHFWVRTSFFNFPYWVFSAMPGSILTHAVCPWGASFNRRLYNITQTIKMKRTVAVPGTIGVSYRDRSSVPQEARRSSSSF